jgi:hypothetical protein
MKNLLLILSLFIGITGYSQTGNRQSNQQGNRSSQQQTNREQPGSRVQAYKIAFITQKLKLTPEDAQKFWPLFNKYEEEILKARMQFRKEGTNEIEKDQKLLEIKKKYAKEFSGIVGEKKTDEFFKAEKEFNTQVQRELMQRRQRRN